MQEVKRKVRVCVWPDLFPLFVLSIAPYNWIHSATSFFSPAGPQSSLSRAEYTRQYLQHMDQGHIAHYCIWIHKDETPGFYPLCPTPNPLPAQKIRAGVGITGVSPGVCVIAKLLALPI